jgi:hypothetical protein
MAIPPPKNCYCYQKSEYGVLAGATYFRSCPKLIFFLRFLFYAIKLCYPFCHSVMYHINDIQPPRQVSTLSPCTKSHLSFQAMPSQLTCTEGLHSLEAAKQFQVCIQMRK